MLHTRCLHKGLVPNENCIGTESCNVLLANDPMWAPAKTILSLIVIISRCLKDPNSRAGHFLSYANGREYHRRLERIDLGGVTSQASTTREAPVRAEPHPTSPIVLVLVIVIVLDFFAISRTRATTTTRTRTSTSTIGGEAKLRLSRGFPRCLAYHVTPRMELVDQSTSGNS
jgi:hypothetical protein